VSEAVEAASLQVTTAEWARKLREASPLALQRIKHAVRRATLDDLDAALAREKEGQLALLVTEDLQEGLRAFQEKRPPRFKGR
jgi:enoyl-CoA hydratase/carnithine racemase